MEIEVCALFDRDNDTHKEATRCFYAMVFCYATMKAHMLSHAPAALLPPSQVVGGVGGGGRCGKRVMR